MSSSCARTAFTLASPALWPARVGVAARGGGALQGRRRQAGPGVASRCLGRGWGGGLGTRSPRDGNTHPDITPQCAWPTPRTPCGAIQTAAARDSRCPLSQEALNVEVQGRDAAAAFRHCMGARWERFYHAL